MSCQKNKIDNIKQIEKHIYVVYLFDCEIISFLCFWTSNRFNTGICLSRFSAKVDEDYKLDIDMNGRRAKISSDADLTLTYTDEDGDKVTQVGDDQLTI